MWGPARDVGGRSDQPIPVQMFEMWAGASLGGPSRGAESGQVVYGEDGTQERKQRTVNTVIQERMTPDELQQRINTYLLAIDQLVKVCVRIEQTQPIGFLMRKDGILERIEQCGWSEEAKELHAKIMWEIEHMKELYLK